MCNNLANIARTYTSNIMQDINLLRSLSEKVNISPEINSYIYSITVFLRMNRAVTGGVTPNSTTHIKQYAR